MGSWRTEWGARALVTTALTRPSPTHGVSGDPARSLAFRAHLVVMRHPSPPFGMYQGKPSEESGCPPPLSGNKATNAHYRTTEGQVKCSNKAPVLLQSRWDSEGLVESLNPQSHSAEVRSIFPGMMTEAKLRTGLPLPPGNNEAAYQFRC